MSDNLIEFACNVVSSIDVQHIVNILPEWKTRITEVKIVEQELPLLCLNFLIAATKKESIDEWLQKYQDKTKTTYSIRTTNKCTGSKVLFKRQLCCHHNTKGTHFYQQRSKNTNCPSKLSITLRAVKKRKQGKDPADAEMPCRIFLIATHNHGTDSVDVLRFRRVGDETRSKLLNLFERGYTPATALEYLKADILFNSGGGKSSLEDRRFCPDYGYCHRLYVKVFKKNSGSLEINNDPTEKLVKRVTELNEEFGENSVNVLFYGSDYCICICLPIFRRIHECMKSASKIVFVDSLNISEQKKMIILFTQNECGDLPLGVLITTSENMELIISGLQYFQDMVGNVFCKGNIDGPAVFLINNSIILKTALCTVWNKSACFISTFRILQSVWHWIVKQKNEIPDDKRYDLFLHFKALVYASTEEECENKFEKAKSEAQTLPNYLKFLDDCWENRTLWATCYRNNMTESDDDFLKIAVQLFREKMYEKLKMFNAIQSLDFILMKFQFYYQQNLIDASRNEFRNNVWHRSISVPTEDFTQQIQIISDNIILVPIERDSAMYYIVNVDVLMCSCLQKHICQHIEWACYAILLTDDKLEAQNDVNTLKMYYAVATGNEPSPEWLLSTYLAENNQDDFSNILNTESVELILEEELGSEEKDVKNIITEVNEEEGTNSLILKGQRVIDEIALTYNEFLKRSPEKILSVLCAMKTTIKSCNSPNRFISACSAFSRGLRVKRYRRSVRQARFIKRRRV